MKDESATLGFLFTAYSGTSRYTFWREGEGDASLATDEYVEPKDWGWNMQKMLYGTVSAADDIGDWENLYNHIGYVHYFLEQLDRLNPAGVTEEEKAQYRAECWFLEAYYHFKVLQNSTSGLFLSNQNILLPQQTSIIRFIPAHLPCISYKPP